MKRIFLVTLISVFAQAQTTEEPQFFYRADVKIDGKVYEVYQTQSGQNMLASKEQMNKRGVFIFKKAKDLLTQESMFTASMGPFGDMGYLWIKPSQIPDPESIRSQSGLNDSYNLINSDEPSTSAFNARVRFTYRPHFYRHVRTAISTEMLMPDDQASIHLSWFNNWWMQVDHDVFIAPINNNSNILRVAVGYFQGSTRLNYVFSGLEPGRTVKSQSQQSTIVSDKGALVSFQFSNIWNDGEGPTFEVSYFEGPRTRRIQGTYSLGFGNKK